MKPYYITTPIYYVNAVPHLGTALTTVAADILGNWQAMLGKDVDLWTGIDCNGDKVRGAAEAAGLDPLSYCNQLRYEFKTVWRGLDINETQFVQTTDQEHAQKVLEVFHELHGAGFIYRALYEGWYDVRDEAFLRDCDVVDGKGPNGNPVERVSEENYFFRLSEFTDQISAHLDANPDFISPPSAANELRAYLKEGLRDVAISRKNRGWGVPIPDTDQVVYVWFDALINYLSYDAPWPADIQLLGKDILTRFHGSIWLGILLALKLPLPKLFVVHGWLLNNGKKMSKSEGNVLEPLETARYLTEQAAGLRPDIALEALRYILADQCPFGTDGEIGLERITSVYNSVLANEVGNTVYRICKIAEQTNSGSLGFSQYEVCDEAFDTLISETQTKLEEYFSVGRVDLAAKEAVVPIKALGKYINDRAPWNQAKEGDVQGLRNTLFTAAKVIHCTVMFLRPFMPKLCDSIALSIGVAPMDTEDWFRAPIIHAHYRAHDPEILLPRISKTKV